MLWRALTLCTVIIGANACDDGAGSSVASEPAPAAQSPAPPPAVDISSAKAPEDTWMQFSSADDGFEVRFPVAPKKSSMDTPNPLGGTIPANIYMAEQGNLALGVTAMTIPASALENFDVEGGLDGGRDGMLNNIGATIVSEKQLKFAGQAARAIEAKASSGDLDVRIEARLFFASPRLYQLIVVSEQSAESPAERFFGSFALVEEG